MKSKLELKIRGFSRVRYSNDYVELELLKPVFSESIIKELDLEKIEDSLDSIALSVLGTRPDVDLVEVETRLGNSTYVYSTSRFVSREYTPVLAAPKPSKVRAIYIASPTGNETSIDLASEAPYTPSDELYIYETPIIVKSEASNRILIIESDTGSFIVDLNTLPTHRASRRASKSAKRKRRKRRKSRRRKGRRRKTASSS